MRNNRQQQAESIKSARRERVKELSAANERVNQLEEELITVKRGYEEQVRNLGCGAAQSADHVQFLSHKRKKQGVSTSRSQITMFSSSYLICSHLPSSWPQCRIR